MKKIASYLTIISLLLITFGCGGGGSGSAKGVSPVTISASFKSFATLSNTSLKAAASVLLTSIRYTVSGSGMDIMTGTVPVTGNLVEFTLNVPNGPQRHFLIEALDNSNNVKYSGEAYKDLDGSPITIEITLLPTGYAFTYKSSDYYPLAQGDTWTYQGPYTQTQVPGFLNKTVSGTETIDSVIATKVLIESGGDYELWTVDSNGITYYKDYHNPPSGWSQEVYDPPLNYLPAEVSIGTIKSHNFTVYFTDSTGASEMAQLSGETTVVALESVTVPAGTFTDCLKTETTMTLLSSTITNVTYNVKTTNWLAKNVGVVKTVKIQNTGFTYTEELHHATVGGISYPIGRVEARSQHWTGTGSDGYYVQMSYDDPNHTATSVMVTGPGVTTPLALTYNAGRGEWNSWTPPSSPVYFGTTHPAPPLTYTFSITDASGIRTETDTISCFQEQFVTNISPTGTVIGTPTFSWTGINDPNALYQVQFNDSNLNRIWDSQAVAGTSVVYNGPPLISGATYYYYVVVTESSTCDQESFARGSFIYQ